MNPYPNYVEASISKDEDFVNEFNQASEKFWNSIPEEFFTKGVRHVKVFRNDENTALYILEKDKGHFTIYYDTIHDFEQDEIKRGKKAVVEKSYKIYSNRGLKDRNYKTYQHRKSLCFIRH